MLANHTPLFVFFLKLLVFLDGQQRINCDVTVVAADACAKNMPRVVTPDCAAREGIRISGHILNAASFKVGDDSLTDAKGMKSSISLSIKFFVKLDPSDSTYLTSGIIDLHKVVEGMWLLSYRGGGSYLLKIQDVGELGQCELASAAQSDPWIQLIGKKLNVTKKKKREAPSGDQVKDFPWMMIGLDYHKHPDGIGHFNLYLNGMIVHGINFTAGNAILGQEITILDAQISCIEYSRELQNASYFTDPALRECMKEYEGQPEQKFVECDANLK